MRKNPTITTSREGLSPVLGVAELPNAAGVSSEALEKGNAMPDVNMQTNDGDNPMIPEKNEFGKGYDCRMYGSSPTSNPTPAMPGA